MFSLDFEFMIADQSLAELLASRICHAMAATVGAVGNGVELVEEFDNSMRDEAMGLIAMSAERAAAQLKFYRMAYGSAGHDGLGSFAEVRRLSEGVIDTEKFTIDWAGVTLSDSSSLASGVGKMLLLMVELSSEALVREGEIRVHHVPDAEIMVSASGPGAAIEPDLQAVLSTGEIDRARLTARTVHGRYTAFMADKIGRCLEWEVAPDQVELRCV